MYIIYIYTLAVSVTIWRSVGAPTNLGEEGMWGTSGTYDFNVIVWVCCAMFDDRGPLLENAGATLETPHSWLLLTSGHARLHI